jgi:PAS domain S-box-containing protein
LRGKHDAELLAVLRRELESLTTAALAADNSTRYVASNAAARDLTGYSQAELLRLTVTDLTPLPRSAEGQRLWQEFIGLGVQRGLYDLQRRDGSSVAVRYWAYASIAPGVHLSLLVPAEETSEAPA